MICKYVLTGGPSSGKTTTILELRKKGFLIVEESARQVIEKQKAAGENIERTAENTDARQTKILELQLKKERETEEKALKENKDIIFLDRGIPDGIAYYHLVGIEPNTKVLEESKKEKTNYCTIFFLEMLPYQKDEIRETKEVADKAHRLVYEAYKNLGYKVIKVPVMSVEERVKFIQKFL
jgi:predicted ATPase